MPDRERVKYDIERCICHVPDACRDCSHYKHGEYLDCMEELLKDSLALLKAQDEIINELLKVGYPHGYEKEEPWIVDYMQLITEVVKKAVHLRNGTE